MTEALISHLERLWDDDEDRATLAALRSSLREGRELDALRVVLPILGSGATRASEDDAALVAGLFALHPGKGSLSLAAAMRLVQQQSGSDSVEGRFRALLGASRADLPHHLRHAVSLVASKDIAIDWRDLCRAVSYWEHPSNRARRRWARDFWTGNEASATDNAE